jgi:hypothetical protein
VASFGIQVKSIMYTYNFDDAVGDEINNNMHIHSGIVVGCPRTMNGFEQHNLVG